MRERVIVVCHSLSWSVHIKEICSKAYWSMYLIRTIPCTSPINIKKSLYLSLVRSQLTYCSQLWFPNKIQDIILLERVQWRATKYILNNYNISYKLWGQAESKEDEKEREDKRVKKRERTEQLYAEH